MPKEGKVAVERESERRIKVNLRTLTRPYLKEIREEILSEIFNMAHEISSILTENRYSNPIDGSRKAEILRSLKLDPQFYNPPELKAVARKDKLMAKLLKRKYELEGKLRYVQDHLRTL